MKRKNVKGLALNKPPPRAEPIKDNDQLRDGDTDADGQKREGQLEIGIEYKLDLKREDLEVLKELGSGNGGTVSKVKHSATGTIMARKVRSIVLQVVLQCTYTIVHRSYTSRLKRKFDVGLYESFISCTNAILTTLSTSTAPFSATPTML
jgi:mitogen-activated protein kinase kinase